MNLPVSRMVLESLQMACEAGYEPQSDIEKSLLELAKKASKQEKKNREEEDSPILRDRNSKSDAIPGDADE